MNKKYLNIANTLTFSRIVLGIFFLILFLINRFINLNPLSLLILEIISLLIFIIAIITDGLDGYFARKSKTVTDFGKHFDPLADSIFFIIVFLTFLILGYMPWFFFIIVVLREGFMHIFLRPYLKYKGQSLPANIFGKIKTFFQSIFTLLIIAGLMLKQLLIIIWNNMQLADITDNWIMIISFIFFAVIAFLSLFSITIYLIEFFKKFVYKKNS